MNVSVFTRVNAVHHPYEDACLVGGDHTLFAIADGVTLDAYPDPSPQSGAGQAAELFCAHTIQHLTRALDCGMDDSVMLSALNAANSAIHDLNISSAAYRGISHDYLENDLLGAVGLVARLVPNHQGHQLHYAYVGDCRLALAGQQGNIKLLNPDPLEVMYTFLDTLDFDSIKERRVFVRSQLRNASQATDAEGVHVGYGVFTGESAVEQFYSVDRAMPDKGTSILLFSDGITPLLDQPRFVTAIGTYLSTGDEQGFHESLHRLAEELEQLPGKKFKDDKTLIVVRL